MSPRGFLVIAVNSSAVWIAAATYIWNSYAFAITSVFARTHGNRTIRTPFRDILFASSLTQIVIWKARRHATVDTVVHNCRYDKHVPSPPRPWYVSWHRTFCSSAYFWKTSLILRWCFSEFSCVIMGLAIEDSRSVAVDMAFGRYLHFASWLSSAPSRSILSLARRDALITSITL